MESQKGTAATKAKNKYNSQNYDSLRIVVEKGKKEFLKNHTAILGESLNGFVNRAIDEAIERDNVK